MPRKGKRKRIARGIYEDQSGRSCIVRDPRTGKPKEFRHPLHTSIRLMRDEADAFVRKHKGRRKTPNIRGTLNHAIERWDGLERHLASWMERRAELRAWAALYGEKRLSAITEDDIRRAVSVWATSDMVTVKRKRPASAKTIRNRLWTLRHLYHVIVGPDVPTPVDHVTPPPKVRTVPTHVSPELILRVYQNLIAQEQAGKLRDTKTRARFMVRAATGRRPSEIMRAQPEDVDIERRVWKVRDGKGGWSEGLYLNDDMRAAWQMFTDANAWGWFHTGSMARVLRESGWPENVRPYSLRHSIGIDLSEGGADLADVGGWLGHTSVQTTRSMYVPVLKSRMQRLSEAIDGRLKWDAVPSSFSINPCADNPQVATNKGQGQKRKAG
jgi:site-specific recombinase XerD